MQVERARLRALDKNATPLNLHSGRSTTSVPYIQEMLRLNLKIH